VGGYDELMNQQKTRAKESSSFESLLPSSIDLVEDTKFIGYEEDSAKAEIKIIFQDGIQTKKAIKGECAIIFDETPFYAESGGQVGDSGKVHAANGSGEIFDTKKMGSQHIHLCRVLDGSFSENDSVEIEIEKEKRDKIVLNHSATHLMHAALRNVLGTHVQQKGSLVNEEKLRFDFSHAKAVSSDEIKLIEDQVNEIIKNDIATEIFETSFDEAIKMGALAFFGDKYGEKVRVLKIGGDYSTELCGGTHVEKTGQIGNFKIVSESSISSGVRRIEAVTSNEANLLLKEESNEIKKIADSFGVSISELDRKVKESKKVIDLIQKKFKEFENINNMNLEKHFESNFEKIDEMNVLMQRIDGLNLSSLRGNLDNLKNKTPKAIIILVGENNSKAQIVVSVTKDLFGTFSAKDILNSLSTKFNFKGGGKDDYAQAGGDSIEVLDRVFEEVRLLISS
jgi:alanyl-tRNA synthetase